MKKCLFFLLILLFVVSYNVAESPPQIYFKYIISGHVTCPKACNKNNIVITLFGKLGEDSFSQFSGKPDEYFIKPVALTDTSGYYAITVNTFSEYDSVKVAAFSHDSVWVFSETYFVRDRLKEMKIESHSCGNGFGCSSCSTNIDENQKYVEYYLFRKYGIDIILFNNN